ncbi:hypothetical protein ABZ478_14620 [Streptomyces sp. NPDC005706]|uniref:hypothetical protein n=1 Tax=Streptomyces sp. NPDC005706 TaxID=3157169 RepID=UPI0034077F0D
MANDPVARDDSVAADSSGTPGAPVAPRPRRRGRAARLIGAGVLLGLLAGVCAGYLVQADREPTKLPPLSQPVIKQAKGEAEPLSAAQDRKVRTDGDLRKLLLAKPRGARTGSWVPQDGWLELGDYADYFGHPGEKFSSLATDQFRRAAVTGWKAGTSSTVDIRLIQYRQEDSMAAADATHNVEEAVESGPGTASWSIPGTGDGMAYVHPRPVADFGGGRPLYLAEAYAWRGDVAMEIWIYSSGPIAKKEIRDLARRQMERL